MYALRVREPTPKQGRILQFIVDRLQEKGVCPTLREIGRRFGVSVGTVQDQVEALRAKGLLEGEGGLARSLTPAAAVPGVRIPILGRVGAGSGVLAQGDVEDYFVFKDFTLGTDFLLRVRGDSMIGAGIMEGDLVQVRRQPTAEDGDVVVALVGEEEGVVKRLRRSGKAWVLESENPDYAPITTHFLIIGKVLGLVRRYDR